MTGNNFEIEIEYLDKNDQANFMGVCVNTMGFQEIKPYSLYPVSCHPKGYYFNSQKGRKLSEFQILYITKGRGKLVLENDSHELEEGNIFIIYPDQWHTYTPYAETGWNEYYIGFEGREALKWLENSVLGCFGQVYNIGYKDELVVLFKRAIELAKSTTQPSYHHLSGVLYHIIGLIILEVSNAITVANKASMQSIERAKIIMNENIYRQIYPEDVAKMLNVNYTTFRKNFKQVTGFAPAHYIKMLKISKAKQLLINTTLPIKVISYNLKYCSPEGFITSFKKYTGYAPNEFRKAFINGVLSS